MSSVETAIEIAVRAHAGQVDKAGVPYIFHPLRLMLVVTTSFERMAAVLHDTVEDTDISLADLWDAGFPAEVVDAVDALTKRTGEKRLDAARRAAKNPIALVVKLADVMDNMDLSRISNPTNQDYERLKEYEPVIKVLLAARAAGQQDPGDDVSISAKVYKGKYQVFVDDNYHYGSESDRMSAGSYRSLKRAINKCKKITISSLKHLYEEGMTPDKLSAQWSMFGDDPFIVGGDSVLFSAREFVTEELCQSIIDGK
jgi:guanosine-3',5'-bis(diphosphate) 3'-pyrophosphohydrolase